MFKIINLKFEKLWFKRQKAIGIKELAKKLISKEFKPQLIKTMNDEEAIEYLSNLNKLVNGQLK